jgi:hypothetical protein
VDNAHRLDRFTPTIAGCAQGVVERRLTDVRAEPRRAGRTGVPYTCSTGSSMG